MQKGAGILLLTIIALTSCPALGTEQPQPIHDATSLEKADRIINTDVIPYAGEDRGKTISRVSAAFLGTRYQAHTLSGGLNKPEKLIADFNGVDCYTLVDYVEALSRSRDRRTFLLNLASVRYINGQISYLSRRHFFSDWFATMPPNARDVTSQVSSHFITVTKQLNLRADGRKYIDGLGIVRRDIHYIPASDINEQTVGKLKNGDYIGIYSPQAGLDVSHVGMVVRHSGQLWFRDASSLPSEMRVIDSPFMNYVRSKPGIVVLRTVSAGG